jgi:hypothetical protein
MLEQDVDTTGQEAINEEGKTTVDEAITLIVNSNPELKAYWDNTIDEEYEGAYEENRQDLIDIITVVDYIIEKYRSNDTSDLSTVFANIEEAFQNPSFDAKELIVTGIFEGLQNSCDMEQLDFRNGFDSWLGPKSKRAWEGLIYLHDSNDPYEVKTERIKTFID